jgi:hypothetical protein
LSEHDKQHVSHVEAHCRVGGDSKKCLHVRMMRRAG